MYKAFPERKQILTDSKNRSHYSESHYPEETSAWDFKDTATPRFGHSDLVFDLLTEMRFLHLIDLF